MVNQSEHTGSIQNAASSTGNVTNASVATGTVTNQAEGRRLGSFTFDEIGTTLNSAVATYTFNDVYNPPAKNQTENGASLTNQA